MNRRHFMHTLAGTTMAATLPFIARCLKSTKKRPNIILIMVDDFGYECVSCNGSTSYQTPNIDKLAETGIRFTNCHSTPLCTPTRVQLMTGQYNFRNYTEFGSLPPGSFTFGHMFQQAGYGTCVAGKWQLTGKLVKGTKHAGEGTMPEDAGFDEHCLWQVTERQSRYWAPWITENGALIKYGDDIFGPDVYCNFLLDYIDRHPKSPFFVYFPMALTHSPFVPTPDSKHPDELEHLPKTQQQQRCFHDMVVYTDKLVGKIVARLNELGLRENTLILFTGDNGTSRAIQSHMGNLVVQGRKGQMAFDGTHVPFVANWRKTVPENKVCDDLIDFTDFMPTLTELAQGAVPDPYPVDGHSFVPQLYGKTGQPREWIYCWYAPRWGHFPDGEYAMDKQFKLYNDGRFYNVEVDRLEEHPLDARSLSAKQMAAKQKLLQVLDAMKKQQP